MLGFGSIGQGILPLLQPELGVKAGRVTIVKTSEDKTGIAAEFGAKVIATALDEGNFETVLEPLLGEGDFLLNLSVDVSSLALIKFCRRVGALYLDTCNEPWPGRYDRAGWKTILVSWLLMLLLAALAVLIAILIFRNQPPQTPPTPTGGSGSPPPQSQSGSPPPQSGSPSASQSGSESGSPSGSPSGSQSGSPSASGSSSGSASPSPSGTESGGGEPSPDESGSPGGNTPTSRL